MSNGSLPFDFESGYDQDSTAHDDRNLKDIIEDMILDDDEGKAQKSVNDDENVPLPRKRKAWFFGFYFSFVIVYLVFILVMTYTYPLKPTCNVLDLSLPVFEDGSTNLSEDIKDSVSLVLMFINRNPLISFSYKDSINITVYYHPLRSPRIRFANAITPGFYQHNQKQQKVGVYMHAPELPNLLKSMNNSNSVVFVVNLVFSVTFNCNVMPCIHRSPFNMNLSLRYP
nr:protein NDR1 [Tanacetum cinerariifolium]